MFAAFKFLNIDVASTFETTVEGVKYPEDLMASAGLNISC